MLSFDSSKKTLLAALLGDSRLLQLLIVFMEVADLSADPR